MKIRTRLILSFLILIFFPFLTMGICANIILSQQSTILADSYQTDISASSFLFNPLHVLYTTTMKDYNELVELADESPDEFADKEFLHRLNQKLNQRYSFLIVRIANEDYFIGNSAIYKKMDKLPDFGDYNTGSRNTMIIDRSIPGLIKSKDFYFTDHSCGQFYLITDLNHLQPTWEHSIKKLIAMMACIIVLTALGLVIWLYRSIVKPMNVLRIATMQIGAGYLDNPVPVPSTDEIGELCRDFEEMRIRLKEMIDERMRYEQDTREMISSMAHDLQTPLTSIKGYAEGILDGVANTPEKQQKYIRTIYSKASDMSYLVDELSIFAKVEQNTLPYHFIPLNLHSYFQDCITEFSLDMETKHVTMTYENTCSEDTVVLADPEQLKRVINNIIGNAEKYMDKDAGTITIRIQDVPLPAPVTPLYRQLNDDGTEVEDAMHPDEFVQVEIRDNGPGIEAKDLPYIFHRFFRADASRNSSKRGSGLGLAIVARIIEDHGGRVWAQSTLGEGTSIFFTLKKQV